MSGPENQPRQPGWWQPPPERPPTWPPGRGQNPYHSAPQQQSGAAPPYYQQPTPAGYSSSPSLPSAQPGQPSKGSKLWLWFGLGVALIAVVAVALVFFIANRSTVGSLDMNTAQAGVQQILTDQTTGYGLDNVSNIKCNDGKNVTAKKGSSFMCDVTVDGKNQKVNVVLLDDKGTFEVDRPR
ncbi:MAG: DUF4333 domain-containing protein [Mycobacteriaceae bacterium]|nr:DUF4333 domain-containing protein [Mycobacteriaceae bacterium]